MLVDSGWKATCSAVSRARRIVPNSPVVDPTTIASPVWGLPASAQRRAISEKSLMSKVTITRSSALASASSSMECFAPDACLVSHEGRLLYGYGPIGALLGDLIQQDTRVSIDLAGVIVRDDHTLAHESWRDRPWAYPRSRHPPDPRPARPRQRVEDRHRRPLGSPADAPLRAIPMGSG